MASSYPMLRYGSSGQEVRRLQQALNRAGYSLEVDGGFGEKTRAALMDYQRRAGMTPDGVAGSKTWASLGLQSAQDRLADLEKGYTPSRETQEARRSWEELAARQPGDYTSPYADRMEDLLRQKGMTLGTAESCTGGLIAQRITSVPGSSEVFGYGFVTYWEAAKARLVGVEPDVIAKYNVVSAPVAAQMALGAAQAAGAEIGISVTGVAGPTGGDALRPVGTVYLGAARGETVYVKKLSVSRPDRALVRARAAQAALELALRLAQGKVPAGTEPLTRDAQHSAEALDKLNEVFLGH